jgi:hypothetical protein
MFSNPGAPAAAWSVLVAIGIPFTLSILVVRLASLDRHQGVRDDVRAGCEVLAIVILSVLFPRAIQAEWLPAPRGRCSHGHLQWMAGVRDRPLSRRNVRSMAVAPSHSGDHCDQW